MDRMVVAGILFLLGACSDAQSSRQAVSQARPAVPVGSERAPVAKAPREPLARVPVYVGGEESLDACMGVSKVVAGNRGRQHSMVRGGPGRHYPVIDSLPLEFIVSDCDGAGAQGEWSGVVYDLDEFVDCGTGSPIATRQAYQGPCQSGWVSSDELELVAG